MDNLDKFEKHMDLLQASLKESKERTKGMIEHRRHMRFVDCILVVEAAVLVIIAYGLLTG